MVTNSLDMFISKLRKKLGNSSTVKITNMHGKDYKVEITKKMIDSIESALKNNFANSAIQNINYIDKYYNPILNGLQSNLAQKNFIKMTT